MYSTQLAPIGVGVFISHSWAYSGHYDKLAEWIFGQPWNVGGRPLHFSDFSVPKDSPIHNARTDAELYLAISNHIDVSSVVVIPTGMYATFSKWIGKEIQVAKILDKPILAVNPWGQERRSSVVMDNADSAVGWNKQNVVNNVWQLFLHG